MGVQDEGGGQMSVESSTQMDADLALALQLESKFALDSHPVCQRRELLLSLSATCSPRPGAQCYCVSSLWHGYMGFVDVDFGNESSTVEQAAASSLFRGLLYASSPLAQLSQSSNKLHMD
jgi:hypothetical protein